MEMRSVLIKAQLIAKRDSSAFVRFRGKHGINGFKVYIPSEDVVERAGAIPVEWIRQQAEEFPGMESAMWGKLIRLWKKKIDCEELYISSNHKNDVPDTNVGDTISRQQAIDAISCDITITGRRNTEIVSATIASFVDRIKALPPAMSDVIMLSIGNDGIARAYDDTYDITVHCESREEQEEVRKALESIPRWIPCSEQMPEEHEWIGTKRFGTTISDEVYVTFENPKGERFSKHIRFQNGKLNSADQHTIDAIYKGSKPIAWMPQPETYKGVTT